MCLDVQLLLLTWTALAEPGANTAARSVSLLVAGSFDGGQFLPVLHSPTLHYLMAIFIPLPSVLEMLVDVGRSTERSVCCDVETKFYFLK